MYSKDQLFQKLKRAKSLINQGFYRALITLLERIDSNSDGRPGVRVAAYMDFDTSVRHDVLSRIGFFRQELEMSVPDGWSPKKPFTNRNWRGDTCVVLEVKKR